VLEKVHQTLSVNPKLVSLLRLTAVHFSRNKNKEYNCKRFAKERISLNICCWNVRTLLDREASSRPERRTALVTRELERLNIDIAALSETRFSDEDQLTEVNSGFTIFWVGKPKGVRRDGGVGFAIRTSLISKLECPYSISDRIMKLRVPLSCGRHMSVFSVYAPTLQASEDTIMSFYGALREAITSIPKEEKLLILGDFNARVGRQNEIWNALGKYGIGNINNNGLNLLQLCSEFNLAISNTFFRQKEKHKVTWIHPRSKHGHMIDFIITRRGDLRDVCNVRVLRSAECDTDHKMVRGKFKLQIRKKIRMEGVKVPKRINVSKLNQPDVCKILCDTFENLHFDGSWENFKNQVYTTGVEVLGLNQKKHRDWFDENDVAIKQLIETKNFLHKSLLNSNLTDRAQVEKSLKEHKAILQRELRVMKTRWWSNISSEVQSAFGQRDSTRFYGLLRQVFGPPSSCVVPVKSKDGSTIIKDPEGIMGRWKEHFTDLFFNPSEVDDAAVDSIPQSVLVEVLNDVPTRDETDLSIKQINTGKSPGLDGIPIELLQRGGDKVKSIVYSLIKESWEGTPIPQDWVDGILVSLYKNKGLMSECDNHCGITLLEAVGKILARILLNRLMEHVCPLVIPESQGGFRSGRGTMDMIFSARQLQEKCIEQHVPLYQVFVDLTKAFDTVNRDALWKILGKLGCPPRFVKMFKELHRDMKARVTFNGSLSDEICIDNGVKQGDIPAPTLFSIYFSVVLAYAFQDCDIGIQLRFRTTGKVFNLRRFKARSKTFQLLVRELLYADDADFVAHTEEDMQTLMDRFSKACIAFGLTISLKKTKVMFTPAPGEPYNEPNIMVNGTKLGVVDSFVYLGSTISRDGSLDAEIKTRIQKGSVAFGKLEKRLWSDRGVTIVTKVTVYQTCVLTALLYSSEVWTTFRHHLKWLERFQQKCLRRILNIKWQSMTPDTVVLQRASCLSIEAMIINNQMRWAGHVVRMQEDRLPKQLFYGELVNGKRPQQKPRKRFKDCVKMNLKDLGINVVDWEKTAQNRAGWRHSVKEGCNTFEKQRLRHAKVKRDARKGIVINLPDEMKSWMCETCGRVLLSKAGYVNHQKAHTHAQCQSEYTPLLPPQPGNTSCVVCSKVCKTTSGLKRHMVLHKDVIPQTSKANPVKTPNFICHLCLMPCKSAAGLKSHLRAHGRKMGEENEEEMVIETAII
jgi:hypothetical protein